MNDLLACRTAAALRTLTLVDLFKLTGSCSNAASGPALIICVIRSIIASKSTASAAVPAGRLITWSLMFPTALLIS